MIVNDREIAIITAALSYMLSNIDDVNEAMDATFTETEVNSLLETFRPLAGWQGVNPTGTVAQIQAIKCAYADLVGAYQARQQLDLLAHDWKEHYTAIDELEQAFDFIEPVSLEEPLDEDGPDDEEDEDDFADEDFDDDKNGIEPLDAPGLEAFFDKYAKDTEEEKDDDAPI